jgi:hypothetical protein
VWYYEWMNEYFEKKFLIRYLFISSGTNLVNSNVFFQYFFHRSGMTYVDDSRGSYVELLVANLDQHMDFFNLCCFGLSGRDMQRKILISQRFGSTHGMCMSSHRFVSSYLSLFYLTSLIFICLDSLLFVPARCSIKRKVACTERLILVMFIPLNITSVLL